MGVLREPALGKGLRWCWIEPQSCQETRGSSSLGLDPEELGRFPPGPGICSGCSPSWKRGPGAIRGLTPGQINNCHVLLVHMVWS